VGAAVEKSGVAKPNRGESEKNLEVRALHCSSALLEDAALVDEIELTARLFFSFISNTPGSNIHFDLFPDDHLVSVLCDRGSFMKKRCGRFGKSQAGSQSF
jgi:hypothetical protein